ncbi:hypothetical protein GCM10009583_20320 [Ornithinicoccus hortensis]
MTVVPLAAADPSRWRVGRFGAYAVVGVCVLLFGVGVVAWARSPATQQAAVLWSLPDTWSPPRCRSPSAPHLCPFPVLAAYFMLLDLLWAVAGVTAALLVLRGARSWFRLYLGSVLAVWATTGGALVAIYGAGLAGSPTWTVELLQGLGWCGAFALAYLFPDGRSCPGGAAGACSHWLSTCRGSCSWRPQVPPTASTAWRRSCLSSSSPRPAPTRPCTATGPARTRSSVARCVV